MKPNLSIVPSDFYRVSVYPGARGLWLEAVGERYSYQLGHGYKNIALTSVKREARIFPADTAKQIFSDLKRIYPNIELEAASFAEWIENAKDLSPV